MTRTGGKFIVFIQVVLTLPYLLTAFISLLDPASVGVDMNPLTVLTTRSTFSRTEIPFVGPSLVTFEFLFVELLQTLIKQMHSVDKITCELKQTSGRILKHAGKSSEVLEQRITLH